MFNKFKKKFMGNRQDTSVGNIRVFSTAWNFYQKDEKDFTYSIRYDLAVGELDSLIKKQHPHTLEIKIPYLNVESDGLPMTKEYSRINAIEDQLSSETDVIKFIAVITGGGGTRFIFCYDGFEDEPSLVQLVQMLMGNLLPDAYAYKAFLNDDFAYYDQNISSDLYNRNGIMNHNINTELEQAGEKFMTTRDINFLLKFKTETYLDEIVAVFIEQDFRLIRREKQVNDTYDLEFVLDAVPTLPYMITVTNWIVEMLADTDGYFDGWGCNVCKE